MENARRILLGVADDGGLDAPRDEGILEVLDGGVVRNVSVAANGPSAAAMAAALRSRPGVSTALHLNLTEGAPLAGPAPSLTGPDGNFLGDKGAFWTRAHGGGVDPGEVAREVLAQAARLRELGLEPVALNGHNHVHLLRGVREGVARALADLPGIRWVRIPAEPMPPGDGGAPPVQEPAMPFDPRHEDAVARAMRERGHGALGSIRVLATRALHVLPGRIRIADSFLGFAFAASGDAAVLAAGLRTVPGHVVELMVHPGRASPAGGTGFSGSPVRDAERETLLSVEFRRAVEGARFRPLSWEEADREPDPGRMVL